MDAGDDAYFADQDGPVIIDRGAAAPSALTTHRPIAQSQGPASPVSFAQVANIRVEVTAPDLCGFRSPTRLVACLDADRNFAAADELALLARLPRAIAVQTGSLQARDAVIVAAARADVRAAVEPVVTAFAGCTGACSGRVVVESAP